jgi:hypothetical protein
MRGSGFGAAVDIDMGATEDIAAPGAPAPVADGEVAHAASDSPATASDSGRESDAGAALGRTLGW